jgi:RHS repeat-associated protein
MGWEFAAPLPHTNAPPSRTMTYDADNRLYQFQGPSMGSLQSVGVDSDGNLTSGPLTNDTFVTYVYDARNRLSNVGGVTNVYDAMNNRIGQTYGTNSILYVVNPNAKLPQVLMRIKNGVTNYYVYGPGLLYQVTEAASGTNTLTYHYDYRGSTIALSGDNGLVTDRMEYSLYATLTYRVGTNDTPFLFNGRYGVQSDGNGLLYMRARYYNPYICRFVSADPSGFAGGLNFYAYANGNPVSYLDPFGLGYWSDVGQVFEGYGLAISGTVTGIYTAATHPINTAVGLYNVAANPVQAYNTISASVANTWNSGLEGQGQIVGNLLIAGATIGSGFATATTRAAEIAAAEPELTEGMSTYEILQTYSQGAQALNEADYEALGSSLQDLSEGGNLYRGILMQQGVDIEGNAYSLTTSLAEQMTTAFSLIGTGPDPLAAIGLGIAGTGVETTGWLGNSGALGNLQDSWSLIGNATQSSSTGK